MFSKFATTPHHRKYWVGQKVMALTLDSKTERSRSEFIHLFKKYAVGVNYAAGTVLDNGTTSIFITGI